MRQRVKIKLVGVDQTGADFTRTGRIQPGLGFYKQIGQQGIGLSSFGAKLAKNNLISNELQPRYFQVRKSPSIA